MAESEARAKTLFAAVLLCFACSPPRGLPPEIPPRIPPIARADAQSPPARDCVRSWPETRYRSYAYDHVVHLSSNCHRIASCTVATNVNPAAVMVAVAPGEHVEVVTARGSELPEFTPDVRCAPGTR